MGLLKVIEILSSSKKGWEDATQNAVKEASKTVKNIKSANVQNMSTVVEKGKISDTEGKRIIEDFLNSTEEKRNEFESKLKKTSTKISETFDFNKKEKEEEL